MQKDGTPNASGMPEPTTGKALSPDSPFAGEKTIELVFDPVVPLPPAPATQAPPEAASREPAPEPESATIEPAIESKAEPAAEPKIESKAEPAAEPKIEPKIEPEITPKPEIAPKAEPKVAEPAPKTEPALKTEPAPKPTPKPAPVPTPLAKPPGAKRQIWLCADDFGISPGVNEAICELLLRGRINATSVMTVAPAFTRAETMPLSILQAGSQQHMAIGLHLTLTGPFKPLSRDYGPLRDGAFLPLKQMLRAALLRRLKPQAIAIEVGAQIKAFTNAFGRPPDFIDGHQHVHIFPQVRDAVTVAARHAAPNAWLRHCGSNLSFWKLFSDRKGLLIDRLSIALQKRAHAAGLRTNPAFAGTYDFKPSSDYPTLFPGFLRGLPDGSVVMCHPGHVDEALRRLDTLTDLREKEYAFFASDDFPRLLEREGVTLD